MGSLGKLLETNRSKNFIIHSATIKKKCLLLLPIMSNLISVTTLASNQTKWEWNLTKEGGHVNGNGNCAKLFYLHIHTTYQPPLYEDWNVCPFHIKNNLVSKAWFKNVLCTYKNRVENVRHNFFWNSRQKNLTIFLREIDIIHYWLTGLS